ncbi:hypothetical protein HaLaN_12955 [Haematococcus lacustris]|uniref:Uncharacterized protein n=1 Tax=Haematococcus lacustris TaxID=44745 RepID=A0A699ZC92_HAELA|nr:hypothetical protein HaLaN_12955 [Haematococcus lacustris]
MNMSPALSTHACCVTQCPGKSGMMMWLTPLKPSAVRLLGRPPPLGVRDFLHGKLRLLPDGTRGSALKDEMHGVIHYPLCASGACAINESYPLKTSLLHPQTTVA